MNSHASDLKEQIKYAINDIRNKNKKRPDKDAVIFYLGKKHDIDKNRVLSMIDEMLEEGEIFCKEYTDGRHSLFISEKLINTDDPMTLLNDSSACSTLGSTSFQNNSSPETNKCDNNDDFPNQQLKFLTNLVYEQQRAYNELFDNYKEERVRNIKLIDDNRNLIVEISNIHSKKTPISIQSISTQTAANLEAQNLEQNSQNIADILHEISLSDRIRQSLAINMDDELDDVRRQKHAEYLELLKQKRNTPYTQTETTPTQVVPDTPPETTSPQVKHPRQTTSDPIRNSNAKNIGKPTWKNRAHEWEDGVTLVTGDSTIGGLIGSRMAAAGNVKVKAHGGANIRDLYDHLEAHLSKKPSRLVIHIGTNNSTELTSDEILEEIIDLDSWIGKMTHEKVQRIYSMPTVRYDQPKSILTIRHLQAKLRNSGLCYIDNSNIEKEHLSQKLLHLNNTGTRILAKNIINFLTQNI